MTSSRVASRACFALVLLFVLQWSGAGAALAAPPGLNEHLVGLAPFVGKTFKGKAGGTDEQPIFDVTRWEARLGGQMVRAVNSLSDGTFAGEMIIVWSEPKKVVKYYYFTSLGYLSEGEMEISPGKFRTLERVFGAPDRIAQIEGTGEILPDGTFRAHSRFLRDGQWHDNGETLYREDAGAELAID